MGEKDPGSGPFSDSVSAVRSTAIRDPAAGAFLSAANVGGGVGAIKHVDRSSASLSILCLLMMTI